MSPPVIGPPSDRARYLPTAFSGCAGCFAFIAVTTNTWLPHTTGELQLRPGMSIFQAMFSVGLHLSGSLGSSAATPACAPRNCGQFCADEGVAARRATSSAVDACENEVMTVSFGRSCHV